jgi:hypothetical protein
MIWLYALIVLLFAIGFWAAYRVLGTPSKLAPIDYAVVLADVATSVERSANRLRQGLAEPGRDVHGTATEAKKIFQTGYYQTLRLRPSTGADQLAGPREQLGRACEAYDWASRMISSESLNNPLVREAACALLDAGDAALKQAARELPESLPGSAERTAPSG